MAFSNLGLQEPSTITARVATVTVQRGSTTEHQEIMVLGDPNSSNGLARVLDTAPGSTEWGVVARVVGYSTTVNVSSLAGVVNVQQNSTVWQVQVGGYSTTANISSVAGVVTVAPQSSNWQVQVTNPSTTVNVSSLGGVVNVQQNSTTWAVQLTQWSTTHNVSSLAGKVTVINSSAADFLATVSQAGTWNIGTVTTVSSLGGVVTVQQNSTVWQVQVGGYSTIVAVSSLGGIVTVRPSDTNWASSAGFHFDSSGALQISGTINASSSTNVTISAIFDSSNVAVQPGDATNKAIRVNVVAGTIVGGSGGTAQADQSAFTTNSGSITPIGGYFSTTASAVPEAKVGVLRMSSVRALWTLPVDSTGGDMTDSTNRGLRVAVVAGGSTTVNVSSVAGVVNVQQNSTVWQVQVGGYSTIVAVSSLAGVVTVSQNSTVWAAQAVNLDNLGNSIESSTNAVGTNSTRRGLAVRSMLPLSTYASGQAASSGDVTVFTSVAGQSIYVYGVCLHWGGVMTTNTNQLVKLQDGNSTGTNYMQWRFQVSAIGATTQPLQAFVAPPAYLFRTASATNLRINAASSGLTYSLYAWYE